MADNLLFDRWAKNYENDIVKLQDQYPFAGYFKLIEEVQNIIAAKSTSLLIDIGVGTGFMLNEILKKQRFEYFGFDFSKQMVNYSKARLNPDNIFEWDLKNPGIPPVLNNIKADFILSAFTLHHFDLNKKLEIISNFFQILKDDGKFIIADISFDKAEKLAETKIKEGKRWDKSEEKGYFLKDEFISALKPYKCSYKKISYCSGLYVINKTNR